MNTRKLLRMLREGILNDRSHRIGGASDYLWSDETLMDYINEAYARFCTRSYLLRDATTPEVTQITLRAGVRDYALDPRVIAVISARLATCQFDLTRASHTFLGERRMVDEHWWDPNKVTQLPPGNTIAYTTDEGLMSGATQAVDQITFRVLPVPSLLQDGEVIQMRVCRKPLAPLTLEDPEGEPELPADNHVEMLDYAAYLALRIVDDDQGAPARAAEFQAQFEGNCTRARNMLMRKLAPAQGWGFGRGGFSWESTNNGWV